MPTFTHAFSAAAAGVTLGAAPQYTGTLIVMPPSVCAGTATTHLGFALDYDAVKAFCITSDVAVTLKTNSSSAPDNTIVLKPNIPYIWTTDSYNTFLITVDIASIYIVNAGGTAANVAIIAVTDSTTP